MKYNSLFLFLLTLSMAAFSCKKTAPVLPPSANTFSCEDSPTVCELTAANGNFAIDLFKKIHNDDSTSNIFISPFSISTALTMTTNGANNQTLTDMQNTLKISGLDMPTVNDSYKNLLGVLPSLDPTTKLKLANSIWPKLDAPVLESFLVINTDYYNSEVNPVDFREPQTLPEINSWISDNTDGLINNALNELPQDVAMLLINAIYFKGAWQTEFETGKTKEADFHTPDDIVKVDMMHIEESAFPYFSNDLFQAIDLPYGDSIFSMSIFLPHEGHEVEEVISEMSKDNWDSWLASFKTNNVQLFLPKFKMEYELKMKRTLSDMGMGNAFTDLADFTNMFEGGGVHIDEVIHKAFVEVNEAGTEAAAVTVVITIFNSVPQTPMMNVNRPFVFVIRDNQTNSILFMGKVLNPTE